MPKPITSPAAWTRRQTLVRLSATALFWPLWSASIGCGAASIVARGEDSLPTHVTGGATNPAGVTNPSNTSIDPSKWATGGTTMLAASYADPFGSSNGTQCAITCHGDAGPCALGYGDTPKRQDISEGQDGLPMYLALQILGPDCAPITDATVTLWHSSPLGLYSGNTDHPGQCQNNDSQAHDATYFRGSQPTDANGKVSFHSCFPGWVSHATVRIFARIARGNDTWLTTQLTFDDSIVDDIIRTQPLYKDRGARDTTNQNDGTLSFAAAQAQMLTVAQMPDGAMLAYKAVVLRADLSDTLCDLPEPDVVLPPVTVTPTPTPTTDPNGV